TNLISNSNYKLLQWGHRFSSMETAPYQGFDSIGFLTAFASRCANSAINNTLYYFHFSITPLFSKIERFPGETHH
ncbi:MAG: hypothetical protein ACP5I1_03875, partial [Candidatus Hinthialibacter sp.]